MGLNMVFQFCIPLLFRIGRLLLFLWERGGASVTGLLLNRTTPIRSLGAPATVKYEINAFYIEESVKPEPVDCVWSPWSKWSACSKSCGGGKRTKTRQKLIKEKNGGSCSGQSKSTVTCNKQNCPGKFLIFHK